MSNSITCPKCNATYPNTYPRARMSLECPYCFTEKQSVSKDVYLLNRETLLAELKLVKNIKGHKEYFETTQQQIKLLEEEIRALATDEGD